MKAPPESHAMSGQTRTTRSFFRVDTHRCPIRTVPIASIRELLEFEDEFECLAGETSDASLVADMLESRMISPPKRQRRGSRVVSSRAAFYETGR
ncbi:MAG: hypothetical protein ABGW78_13970 [Pirellulales bacterium]